jgi:alpha-N-acetylglucosamine transferase
MSAALVTCAIGAQYQKLGQITHPAFRRYADRYGLDFIVLAEQQVGQNVFFAKLACADLLDRYDRLIFMDTDIVLAPDCPDLLDVVPEDHFGAYLVSQHTDWHDKAIELIQQHLPDLGWKRDYFNSGLFVCSKLHRPMFDPTDPLFPIWDDLCAKMHIGVTFAEQTWLNYKWQQIGFPLHDVGYRFNHTLAPKNSEIRFSSHIIHCKGHRKGSRLKEVRRTRLAVETPALRRVLTAPTIARLYDALP